MTNPYVSTVSGGIAAGAIWAALAGPALALTPDELWEQWQAYLQSSGYAVTAEESTAGDVLTLSNLTATMEMETEDDKTAQVTITVGEYTLTGQNDGSVVVSLPASQPVRIHVEGPGEEPVDVTLDQRAEGFSMVASGTPEDTDYTYSADSIGFAMTDLQRAGAPVELGTVEMEATGLSGTTAIARDAGYTVEQELTAEGLTYTVDIVNPEPGSDGTFRMNGSLEGISSTGGGTMPEGVDMTDLGAAMKAGYAVNATLGYSAGETTLAFREGEEWFDYRSSSEGGSFIFGLDAQRLSYQVLASMVSISASGAEVPFPVDISAGEAGLRMSFPLAETEEPEDFSLALTLSDVALPDQAWAMADPTGGLPHDPLTVEIALSGTGRLFVDLTDEEAMAQLSETGGAPGEVDTLTVEKLTVRGLGAEIGATAELEVDNEAPSPFGQGPNVWGTANIRMTGVMALINTLSQMGLIPPAQAMMGAGMLSQLGKPVSGPDDLEADIEMTEQGQLSINGAPMPLR